MNLIDAYTKGWIEELEKTAANLGMTLGGAGGAVGGTGLGMLAGIPLSFLYEALTKPEQKRDYAKALGRGVILGGSAGALTGGALGSYKGYKL